MWSEQPPRIRRSPHPVRVRVGPERFALQKRRRLPPRLVRKSRNVDRQNRDSGRDRADTGSRTTAKQFHGLVRIQGNVRLFDRRRYSRAPQQQHASARRAACLVLWIGRGADAMKWRVILEPDPETGDWAARCPELPGCASAGRSQADALENIREAIELYVQPDPLNLSAGAVPAEVVV